MTGAELLALARHNRGAGEDDGDTALHLATALAVLWLQLTAEQRRGPEYMLWRMLDHMHYDQGITPWTR